ncbi:NAD(P)-dependent oxidoreductase [Nitrosopumilus sp.]|nr:NAD(P)-dependent oxidoreductase [Nitrosopumilus sp.]MDB4839981.1 NAD(P)-dependent oxidoreductase [Nitrosopumilus sp.]
MTKILIFGGSGFIGKHLINKMNGIYDFLSLSRNLENNSTYSKVANILEPKSYEPLLENTEIIINLVGQVEPDLEKFTATNLVGSLNLLNSAVKYDIKNIILISTINVYGENNNLASKENDILSPKSNYGVIKMMNEKLYEHFSKLYGINVTILRLSGVYGPGKIKGFFPQMINAITDKTITLRPYNYGNQLRDFIYVDDAIDGIIKSINKNFSGFNIFNICSSKLYSIKEIIRITEKLANSHISVEYNSEKFDEKCLWGDNSKAKLKLNFEPKFSLNSGIKKILDK